LHTTAFENCQEFFNVYGPHFQQPGATPQVLEIGSQNVNGSLRGIFPAQFHYTGVDFAVGNGVDLVLEDPYSLPIESESIDIVLSSSCFEHSEMFWLVFLEIMRVLKPGGLFYLNAPSNGDFHRYPVDCWRFYPDSGRALVAWARRNGMRPAMLESYTSAQRIGEAWSDFVAVFIKDESMASNFPRRIVESKEAFMNGLLLGSDDVLKQSTLMEDGKRLAVIREVLSGQIKIF
jgi:SAM-dependent methyltransferase